MISQIQHSSWPCKPYSQQTHLYSFILVVFVDLLVCEVYRYHCHLVLWCYVQYLFPHHRQVVWFSRPEGQHRNHHRDHHPWHHLHPELLSIHARHQHHYCTSFTVSGARGYWYNFIIISHRQMNNDFLHS